MKLAGLRGTLRFATVIGILTLPISAIFDTSTIFLNQTSWWIGLLVVLLIVIIGVLFDMLGLAAAAARETPFHAMASKRVYGAKTAIVIVRNAEKVSSICSDVIGDIAGVLSGAGALAVGVQITRSIRAQGWHQEFVAIVITALVTSATVGAKAVGKTIAIHSPTPIVLYTAKVAETLLVFRRHSRKRKRRKS